MKKRKLTSLISALVILFSFITAMPITASAAYSAIEINIAPNPCYANLSSSPLPDSGTPTQGDTCYLNLAATTDYKLAKAEFYAKAPSETAFTCVYRYEPSGYFRWVNCPYTFTSAGYYEFRIDITTTGGAQGSAIISTNIEAKQTAPTSPEPVTTSYSVKMNVSSQPCTANLSVTSLPEYQIPAQGDTYYLNLACTDDYKLDHAEFYIKAPGQNEFALIYQYNPSNYFRWVNYPYSFTQSGTYIIRIDVTATDGAQASGDISFDVAEKTTTTSNSNTYTYDDITFDVVPNLKSEYCYNQNDYPRFNNNAGKNRGCTATAMCTAYSIYHDNALSPNDVKWSWAGTSWEYCNRFSDSNKVYKGYTYTQSEALTAAYNCVNSGKPIIVGVNGSGSNHVVTIVGVKQYADKNNLSLSDFLIVDPLGGTVETLNTYTSIDCGWGLRIPME